MSVGNDGGVKLSLRASVTCPRCWASYAPEDTLWISSDHPLLRGDARLGAVPRRFRADRFTTVGAAIDAVGAPCSGLACPVCHLEVPRVFYAARPFFVSVLGRKDVGVDEFVAAMARALRATMPERIGTTLLDADSRLNRPLHVMEQAMAAGVRGFGLFESLMQSVSEEDARDVVTLAAGDSLKLPRPFVFRVEPRDAAGRAAFGDSGRAVSVNACFGREYEASPAGPGIREVAYLGAAHLHVFLVDPSGDGRESHGHDGRVFAAAGKSITVPQYTVLQAAAELSRAVRERKPQRPQQCPLVVVVPRFDEWRESLADGISEGVMSAVRFGATGDGMQVVSRVSLCVRSYLEKLAPELVAIAEHNWSDVTYVPCTIFRASSFDAPSAMTPADSQSPLRSRPAADHLWCDVPLLIGLSKALGMPMEGSDNVQRRAARGQL